MQRGQSMVGDGRLIGRGGVARRHGPHDGDGGVKRQPGLAGDEEALTAAWSGRCQHILGMSLVADGSLRRSSTRWWISGARGWRLRVALWPAVPGGVE